MWKILIIYLCFWSFISCFTTTIPKKQELCVGANVKKKVNLWILVINL